MRRILKTTRGNTVLAAAPALAEKAASEALIMGAVKAFVDQTRSVERAIVALGVDQVKLEGSDSSDDPNAVFQQRNSHPSQDRASAARSLSRGIS